MSPWSEVSEAEMEETFLLVEAVESARFRAKRSRDREKKKKKKKQYKKNKTNF